VTIPQWKVSAVCENHPTLDRRVRRALNLAIDKRALSKGPHFGFSTPIGSIYHAGSFGARPEVVSNPSPYDLQEAKRLMKEAGYENGFTMVGHFGQFAGRPGIPEAADFIASSWQKLGVKVTWQEHDPSDFVRSFRPGFFSSVPVNLQTWGRQDHSGLEVTNYNSTAGYVGVYNDKVEDLYFDINATPDPEEMKRKLALLEDEVLSLEETFPLYGMSLVNAYSDRVLAHPTVEFSPHFKHYDLVLLKH
jgi:peptide/nickel transport system substrate-binding protein